MLPLYPTGCPLTLCSPVASWRKFSAVLQSESNMVSRDQAERREQQAHLGTTSEKSSILILPAGVFPIETSKNAIGRGEAVLFAADMMQQRESKCASWTCKVGS
jgi:hypothetical protein